MIESAFGDDEHEQLMQAQELEDERVNCVDRLWPYDGPHDRESVTTAAEKLPELVRYLNNATQRRRPLEWVNTIDAILGSVGAALYGLDQLMRQLGDAMTLQADNASLYDDRRSADHNARRIAIHAAGELDECRKYARSFGAKISGIRDITSHLGNETGD